MTGLGKAVAAAVLFVLTLATLCVAEPTDASVSRIEQGILSLTALAPNHPARNELRRRELAVAVVEASRAYDLDPLLLLTWAFFESSLRPASVGALGEVGLMQLHGAAADGCDLSTVAGQALCGAAWMRRQIDACGSLVGGLTAYASGSCRVRTERTRHMIDMRLKRWADLRSEVGDGN